MSFERRVAAASADWIYLPEDAPRIVTDEFVAVCYPPTWTLPTQVRAITSDREPADLIVTVERVVRG